MNLDSKIYASGLPQETNKDLQSLFANVISSYVIANFAHTLPLNAILPIGTSVDLCGGTSYLVDDPTTVPDLNDTAVDSFVNRRTLTPPRMINFNGWVKSELETKLGAEQLHCINQSPILKQWFNRALDRMVSDGRDAIMARFYRHMMSHVPPANTGLKAGFESKRFVLGDPANPVVIKDNDGGESVDRWLRELLNVVKEMPRSAPVENEYGVSAENSFLFGPTEIEHAYMASDKYNTYNSVGDCAGCSLFTDTFDKMPRGIFPLTSFAVEKREVVTAAGQKCTIYPVLFGKRNIGTEANLSVQTSNWMTPDKKSFIFNTTMYSSIHTYDPRYLGVSWVTFEQTRPQTKNCA